MLQKLVRLSLFILAFFFGITLYANYKFPSTEELNQHFEKTSGKSRFYLYLFSKDMDKVIARNKIIKFLEKEIADYKNIILYQEIFSIYGYVGIAFFKEKIYTIEYIKESIVIKKISLSLAEQKKIIELNDKMLLFQSSLEIESVGICPLFISNNRGDIFVFPATVIPLDDLVHLPNNLKNFMLYMHEYTPLMNKKSEEI